MESSDNLKKMWAASKAREANNDLLSEDFVKTVIRSRVKKEKNVVTQYFWASFVYQIFIYAFASHCMIRFWRDSQILLLCLVIVLLYIPFTVILLKKFKAMSVPKATKSGNFILDIKANIENQFALLSQFYLFKKRFDLVAVPVSCLVIIAVTFKLYVPGGIKNHLMAGLISYLTVLSIFITATYIENKKRFKLPLGQFKTILEDIERA